MIINKKTKLIILSLIFFLGVAGGCFFAVSKTSAQTITEFDCSAPPLDNPEALSDWNFYCGITPNATGNNSSVPSASNPPADLSSGQLSVGGPRSGAPAAEQNLESESLGGLINQIYLWSIGLGSLLALLMIIFGGYLIMAASGNAQEASLGKDYIWGAIVGLILLFSAFLILNTINPDLTNFEITGFEEEDTSQ